MRKLILVVVTVVALVPGCAGTKTSLVAGCYRKIDPVTTARVEYRIEQNHASR